jgi:hypothetical protein
VFAALTRPDRQAEITALHRVRQSLDHAPDQKSLDAARTQLDALLQAEDRFQGDIPPALVASNIASRIENAIAGLEQARAAAEPPLRAWWVMPSLAGAAGTLGVALIAALVASAGRGGQSEEHQETREAVGKLRRQVEAATDLFYTMQTRTATAFDEAAVAAQDAATAVLRLNGASKDAETRLLGCVDDVEARLQAASSFDQTADSLHERLVAVVDGMEGRGLRVIEAAAAELASSSAILASVASGTAEVQQQIADGAQTLARTLPGTTGGLIAASAAVKDQLAQSALALDGSRAALEISAEAVTRGAHQAASCTTRLTEAITAFALPAETASLLQAARELQDHGFAIAEAAHLRSERDERLADQAATALRGVEVSAGRVGDTAAQMAAALDNAAAALASAEIEAQATREAQAARFASVLESLLDRADAVLGALPAEASAVAAMAAQLRGDTAALCQAADRIEHEAASEASAVSASADSMLGVLRAACVRLEDVAAGLGGAGALIRQDAAALRDETRLARATTDMAGDAHRKAA